MSAELKNVSYAEREKQVRQAKLFDEYKLFSQDAEKKRGQRSTARISSGSSQTQH
jgi:hypothetical protein